MGWWGGARVVAVSALIVLSGCSGGDGGVDGGAVGAADGAGGEGVDALLANLLAGECVDHRTDTANIDAMDMRLVPCDEPHRFEVTSTSPLSEHGIVDAYDRLAIDRAGHEVCLDDFETYVGVAESVAFTDGYLVPDEEQWEDEELRRLVCTASAIGDPATVAVRDAEHAAPTTTMPTVTDPALVGTWTSTNGENVVTFAEDGAVEASFASLGMTCTGGRVTQLMESDDHLNVNVTGVDCPVDGATYGSPQLMLDLYEAEGRLHVDYVPLTDDDYENQCVVIFRPTKDESCELRLG